LGVVDAHENVRKRLIPLDYKEDRNLASVKDEAIDGAKHP